MEIVFAVLKMGGALLIVLGGIATTAYFAKRFLSSRFGLTSVPIKILATSYLGVKKQITLIEVGGVYLLLGITPQQISLLTRMETLPLPKAQENG